MHPRRAASVAALILVGCGGKAIIDPEGGSTTSPTTTAAGGSGGSGGTGGAGGEGANPVPASCVLDLADDITHPGNQFLVDVASNSLDDLVMTGIFEQSVWLGGPIWDAVGPQDLFLGSWNADGSDLWSATFGTKDVDGAFAVDLGDSDSLWLAGLYRTEALNFGGGPLPLEATRHSFMARFSPDGSHQVSRGFGTGTQDIPLIATRADGGAYFSGGYSATYDFGSGPLAHSGTATGDRFVLSLGPLGETLWARAIASPGPLAFAAMTADGDDGVIVSARFDGEASAGGETVSAPGLGGIMARWSADGDLLWTRSTEGGAPHALAFAGGRLFAAGVHQELIGIGGETLAGEGVFVAAFDPDGSLIWARSLGGVAPWNWLALDADGEQVVVAARTKGPLDGTDGACAESALWVMRLDHAGNTLCSACAPVGQIDFLSVATRQDGGAWLGASFTGALTVGDEEHVAQGSDVAVIRLSPP